MPAASVNPEPGSNSPSLSYFNLNILCPLLQLIYKTVNPSVSLRLTNTCSLFFALLFWLPNLSMNIFPHLGSAKVNSFLINKQSVKKFKNCPLFLPMLRGKVTMIIHNIARKIIFFFEKHTDLILNHIWEQDWGKWIYLFISTSSMHRISTSSFRQAQCTAFRQAHFGKLNASQCIAMHRISTGPAERQLYCRSDRLQFTSRLTREACLKAPLLGGVSEGRGGFL